jgi:hypothetical protein
MTLEQPGESYRFQCGYCTDPSVAWIEWRCIGRQKGSPVCTACLCEYLQVDNFNETLTVVNAEYVRVMRGA